MMKARGLLLVDDGFGAQARETFTCVHCGNIRIKSEQTQHWCSNCDAMVCSDAACCSECKPWRRKMDEMEARARFRASLGG